MSFLRTRSGLCFETHGILMGFALVKGCANKKIIKLYWVVLSKAGTPHRKSQCAVSFPNQRILQIWTFVALSLGEDPSHAMKKEHNVTVLFDAGWTALPWYVARHIFLAVERGESVPPEEVAPLQGHCSLLFASLLWRCQCWTTSKKPNCVMSVISLEFTKNWSWIVTPYTVHIRTLYNSLHNEKASEASRVDWADWMCGSACFTWHWQFACKLSYLREKTL